MTVQAIETVYKGYRFRSRLEARWAVVFDQAGLHWQYEAEGFVVDGVRYLPDFYLEELNTLIEIKPRKEEEWKLPPTVYMAGKMGARNWRNWRPSSLPDVSVHEEIEVFRIFDTNGRDFFYSGPFGDIMSNHSFLHGLDSAAWCYEEEVIKRSFDGIKSSDCVLVLIDQTDVFGTLVEIGYAKAWGKKIFVAVVSSEEEVPYGEWFKEFHEMWFAIKCATEHKLFIKDIPGAVDWLFDMAGISIRPEVRLLSSVASGLSKGWSIIYGTPGEHIIHGSLRLDPYLTGFTDAGRHARFEHGEAP